MSEEQAEYIAEAKEMLGNGYTHSPLEIHPQQVVISRRGWGMQEEVIPAFIKISTDFKAELKLIDATSLKVWIFLALSINRNTEQAHPGIRTIAEACGMGQNTVIAAVKDLERVGLLTVNREDRKYNIYEIPAYVSANNKTASVLEADAQTASKIDKTASENPQTASVSRRLNQINQSKPEKNIHTEKPDFQNLSVNEAMSIPELQLFRDATGYFPGCPLWETIFNDLREHQWTLEQIKAPWVEWCKRGYNTKSLAWMEWIGSPIPERAQPRTSNSKYSSKPKSAYAQLLEMKMEDLVDGS